MKAAINYWFTIDPYVFVNITNQCVLLYNTLDGVVLESDKPEVIELFYETIQEKNCGITLLTNKRYRQKDIHGFISELREKYMGDIIDTSLSRGKPVQLLPYFNFQKKLGIYKMHNFSLRKNVLENLSEIDIHIDSTIDIMRLLPFLQSIQKNITFNIIGCMRNIVNYDDILSFFNQNDSPKNILCSYENMAPLQSEYKNNFSYQISVNFPIDMQQWMNTRRILFNQTLPVEYVFDISSNEEIRKTEQIIEQFQIEKYRLNPIYTGDNICFFEENIFLTKEDILSTPMTIKDFFARQAINIYNYGKINILPNGDAYANLNHPMLGNIYTDSLYEIVQKEVDEGKSWFNIRNQAPCNNCVYQWLCPSPSNYEIAVGRSNLCHVCK